MCLLNRALGDMLGRWEWGKAAVIGGVACNKNSIGGVCVCWGLVVGGYENGLEMGVEVMLGWGSLNRTGSDK